MNDHFSDKLSLIYLKNNKWNSLFFILFLYSLLVFPAIFIIRNAASWNPEACDSVYGHIPLINYFLTHPIHIFSYPSVVSTLPGYHLFLTFLSFLSGIREVHETTWLIRVINAMCGAGLLVVVWNIVWRLKCDAVSAFSLLLPVAFSYYVLAAAIWINTDDIAAFFYSLLILLFLTKGPPWAGGLVAFCMIMCRQIYFPVIAAFWLAGVVADEKKQALKFAACVTLVSTITMALFVWQWHGLTPGYSQDINKFVGISLSGILHEFSMLGVLAIAYLPIFCADRRYYKNYFLLLWALAALFSFILWASTFSTPDFDAGRGGSVIWRIAGITPSYHQHSWIILFLSFLGMFSLLNMIFHAIFLRYYPIETIMLLCYFLSCASQIFAFQRYVEIPILITYAVFGARVLHASRLSFAGPFLLATSFGFITILRISMKILGKTITT